MGYSNEYKEDLKEEYKYLKGLYDRVLREAGDGPYTEEEELIISDYNEVCAEYEEVFKNKPHYKVPLLEKAYKKKELPASKREPVYCDTAIQEKRVINLEDYVKLGGVSNAN